MAKSPTDAATNTALNAPGMVASGEIHAPEGEVQHILVGVYEIQWPGASTISPQIRHHPLSDINA